FNVSAARKLAERLIAAAESLTEHADRGRFVREDVRELVTVRPYIIRYEIADGEVHILTIHHSAQQPE
ncbi:MAG: type II toxin-antitoxin system RelE/ParE family toxin, partial [Burkholderiales bacterium]